MNTINFIKAVKRVFALPLISWGAIICMFLLISPAMLFSQSGEKYSVNGNYLGVPDILGSKNYAPLNFATNSTIRALFTADGNFEAWYDSYFKKNVTVDSTITAWEMYAMYRLSVYGDVVVTGIMKSAKLILTDGNITSMTGTVVFGSNNLATTGNVTAGSFNSPSFAGSSRAMLATDTAGNIIRKEYSGNPDEVLTGDGNWSNLSQSTGWQWVDSNLVSTAAQVVVANNLAVGGKISVGQIKVISNGSNKDTLHTEKELVIITDSKNISLEADTVKIPRLLDSKRMETDTLNSKKINSDKVYVAGDITSTGTVYTGNLYVANDVMLPLFAGTKNLLLTDSTGKVSPLGISSTPNKVLLSNGTWGAVPIPQNYWQMQNDDIYTLTPGNIGLGMNNPAYKLDVAGTVRISEDLLVGGGIIISEKVNATRELKSASLRADSIFMDNTKAFYGESRFADSVKIQSKLRVDGNIDAGGDLRASGSLIFGSNKNISYFPHQNGITGDLCFGTPIPAYTICNPPVTETNQNWFGGTVNMWGNPSWNPLTPSSVLKIGSDGSNGIIEIEGTNAGGGEAGLLINYYCGRNVVVGGRGLDDPSHPGPETGTFTTRYDTYLAERNGKVRIGSNQPANAKLDIHGDVRISDLIASTGTYNIVVADEDGLLGTKDVSEIGDDLGNHTATDDIILGDNWISREANIQGQEKRGMHIDQNGDFTFLVDGLNSFEIKGNSRIPFRRGISLNEDVGGGTGGEFNLWLSLWQDASFNFKGYAPQYEDQGVTYPAVTKNFMTILKNGNIGIGTTSPQKNIHIVSKSSFDANATIRLDYFGYSGPVLPGEPFPEPNTHLIWDITNNNSSLNFNYGYAEDINPNMTTKAKIDIWDNNTELHLISPSNNSSILWSYNSNYSYGFGIGADNNGHIFQNINDYHSLGTLNSIMTFTSNGNVGIGTTADVSATNYRLSVFGTIHSKEVVIETNNWGDYVFDKNYKRMNWEEKLKFINDKKHLPAIASGKEIENNGLKTGATMQGMIQNIEENTLDIIDMYQIIIKQNEEIDLLKKEIEQLKMK